MDEKRSRKTAQSNALVRAEPEKKTVSKYEGIIKQLLMLKMQDLYRQNLDPFEPIVISVDDIIAEIQMDYAAIYDKIDSAAWHLSSYRVRFEKVYNNNKLKINFIPFFKKLGYDTGKGIITAQFNDALKEHLIGLTKNFTLIEWDSFKELTLISAQKMFELLCSYKNLEIAEISLEEIHTVLQTTEYQRQNYKNFMQVVLNPAIEDIQKNAKWFFDITPKRTARKITSLVFDFTPEGVERAQKKIAEKAMATMRKKLGMPAKKIVEPADTTPKRPRGRPRKNFLSENR